MEYVPIPRYNHDAVYGWLMNPNGEFMRSEDVDKFFAQIGQQLDALKIKIDNNNRVLEMVQSAHEEAEKLKTMRTA